MRMAVAVMLMLVAVMCVSGCTLDKEGISAAREQVELLQQDVLIAKAQMYELDMQIAALPEGEDREAARLLVEHTRAYLDKAVPMLKTAEARLAELEKAKGFPEMMVVGGETIQQIGESVPVPWATHIAWAGALLATLGRAWSNRRDGRKVAESVDKVKRMNLLTDDDKKTVNKIQGPGGRRLVDEAQGKALSLPF